MTLFSWLLIAIAVNVAGVIAYMLLGFIITSRERYAWRMFVAGVQSGFNATIGVLAILGLLVKVAS